MTAAVYLLLVAIASGALFAALAPLIKAWWNARGQRLATRPETQEPAAVEIDPMDAAFQAFLKPREIHLQSCTRWPEKAGCGQECMSRIAVAPSGCLVQRILAEWYDGTSCALCGKALSTVFGEHEPALLSPDRVSREWADQRAEDLPELLLTHQPVCWDCHVVETLYRMHPEPITERAPNEPDFA